MKKIFTILGFLFSLSSFAQNTDGVVNALKNVDAVKFTGFFDNSVDIILNKNEMANLSKSDASNKIQTFFMTNKITGFDVISPGRELDGTSYIAGKLKGDPKSYNITVMLKKKGDDMLITQVRIN